MSDRERLVLIQDIARRLDNVVNMPPLKRLLLKHVERMLELARELKDD
jgi:hypothetical protein